MIQLGSVWVDLEVGVVERPTGAVALSEQESTLLGHLALNTGQVIPQSRLLALGRQAEPIARADLTSLQQKLEADPAQPVFLREIEAEGWRFVAPGEALPVRGSAFFGRTAERAWLAERWRRGARLITIVGFGGLGKTRLALEVARQAARSGRVCWVELDGVSDAGGLRKAVVRALGGAKAEDAEICRRLEGQGTLLVLDNLDDVAVEAGPAVAPWLAALPGLRVLGTSQQALTEGETLSLAPLTLGESQSLLMNRARWSAAESPEAMRIAEQLGGLPLAVELLASQVAGQTARSVVVEAVLQEAQRLDGPPRQATLTAAISRSLLRLDEDARRALESLTILNVAFDQPLAQIVTGSDVVPLESLQVHGFLQRDGSRWRVVTAIRHHLQRHPTAEIEAAWERLVEWINVRAERSVRWVHAESWLPTVGMEILLLTHAWALSQKRTEALNLARIVVLDNMRSCEERQALIESTLEQLPEDSLSQLRLRVHLATILHYSNDRVQAEAVFDGVIAEAEARGETELLAFALVLRSTRGPLEDRVAYARRGAALTQEPTLYAQALINEGFAHRSAWNHSAAREVLERVEPAGDPQQDTLVVLGLGGMCHTREDVLAFRGRLERLRQHGRVPEYLVASLRVLEGYHCIQLGEFERGQLPLHSAVRLFRQQQDQHNEVTVLWNLCLCYMMTDKLDLAARYLRQAEHLGARVQSSMMVLISAGRTMLSVMRGDTRRARRSLPAMKTDRLPFWRAVIAALDGRLEELEDCTEEVTERQLQALRLVATKQRVPGALLSELREEAGVELGDHFLVALLRKR